MNYRYSGSGLDPSQRVTPVGGPSLVHVPRTADVSSSPAAPPRNRFAGGILDYLVSPRGRLGTTILAGVPIAMAAVDQLNADPTNPGGNLSGAAGAAGLGALGAVAGGALGQALIPIPGVGAAIGAGLGGAFGAKVGGDAGRNAFNGIAGVVGDPVGKEIRDNRARAESMIDLQKRAALEGLPMRIAYDRADLSRLEQEASIASSMRARDAYAQALFGAALGRPGAYADPGFSAALAGIANRGFA